MGDKGKVFELLFKPLTVKGTSIRNRIVMPAMNTNLAERDGSVSERFTNYFVERGKGGVGLIVVSPGYIDPAARKRGGSLLYHDDRYIPRLKELASAIHRTGAKVLQQLNHNGRLVTSSKELKTAVTKGAVGPSPVPHLVTGEVPHVLTVAEIGELIEGFGQAARRAKEAGFDGVELHGTQGYLINQFFSLYSNRRTDEYGGNLENRMRFPLDVCHRVRKLTGKDFLVSYRANAREFAPIETPLEDVVALCQRLEEEGIDLLSIAVGNGETPANLYYRASLAATSECYRELFASIRARVKVPMIAVGGITTPEIAEGILRDLRADLVATGKALIADPHWPEKALRGESERIRRCIGCYQGCLERLAQEKEVTCLYNPEVGREGNLSPAPRQKKVWVIGGGPGGMEAAVVLAARGHEVHLFERETELGGQSLLTAATPGKEAYLEIKDYLANELRRAGASVHLGKDITATEVLSNKPDAVVVATGSVPLIPEIPGIGKDNVITAWEGLKGKEMGEKVVVAGRGYVGAETALFLAKKGRKVVLLEMLDAVGQDVGPMNRIRLKEGLQGAGVDVRCETELLSVGEKTATVRGKSGEQEIAADTIVLALGGKPRNDLLGALEGKVDQLFGIGDCVEPRQMIEAIYEAYDVALRL